MKKILSLICAAVCSFSAWSKEIKIDAVTRGAGVKAAVLPCSADSKTLSEFTWISETVRSSITTNFSQYTRFTMIDKVNTDKRLKEIKNSESVLADKTQRLKIGKTYSAEILIVPKLITKDVNYILEVQAIEVESGKIIATASGNYTIVEISNQYAMNEISCILFTKGFNFKLTENEKKILLQKEEKESIDSIRKQISEIEKEIKRLDREFEIAIAAEKNNLSQQELNAKEESHKAEINRNKIIIESLRQKEEQKKLEEEKLKKDLREQEKMNKAQKALLKQKEAEALKKKEQLAFASAKKFSALQIISINENNKEELNKIINKTVLATDRQITKNEEAFKKEEEKINSTYRNKENFPSFYDGNTFNKKGEKAVAAAKKEKRKEYDAINNEDIQKIIGSSLENEQNILDKIKENQNMLKKIKYTDKSIINEENIILEYDEYDGSNEEWNLNISFYFNNNFIWRTKTNITFQEATGNKVIEFSPDNETAFQNFQNEIKVYDSLFRQNKPVLIVEVDYEIEAASVYKSPVVIRSRTDSSSFEFLFNEKESCYNVKVTGYRIYNTYTGKMIKKESASASKNVDCSLNSRCRVWNSEEAWKIFYAGSRKVISKENTEKEKIEKRKQKKLEKEEAEREQKKRDAERNKKITEFKNDFSDRQENYPDEGFDFFGALMFDNSTKGFTLGAAYRFPLIDLNFLDFGVRAETGGLGENFYFYAGADIYLHALVTDFLGLYLRGGLGFVNIYIPEITFSFGCRFIISDDFNIIAEYNFASLAGEKYPSSFHGPLIGVSLNNLKLW